MLDPLRATPTPTSAVHERAELGRDSEVAIV